MSANGYSENDLLDDGYAIFEPPTTKDPMRGELVEAYWRGTRDEAEDAMTEYLAQRVSSDD